jgi:hypothetical protein
MMYMRKNIICLLALIGCLLIAGCNSGKKEDKRKEYIPLKMDVSSKDTVAVTQLSEKFMKLLQKEDYESALNMLYFLNKDGEVVPLTAEQRQQQLGIFKVFPVIDYTNKGIIFNSEKDSQVKFEIQFTPSEEDKPGATTNFFLKPMRVNGEWFLTTYDSQSGRPSQIKN